MFEAAGLHNLKIGGGWSKVTNDVENAYPNGMSHEVKVGERAKGRLIRLELNVLNVFNQKQTRHVFPYLNRIGANGRSVVSSRFNTANVDLTQGYDYLALLALSPDAQKSPNENARGSQDPRYLMADQWNPGLSARFSVRLVF